MAARGVTFLSLSYRVPSQIISSTELEEKLNLYPGIIERLTGIRNRRYITKGESLQSLAVEASLEALDRSGCKSSDIDSLIFYSDSPPVMPGEETPQKNYYDISAHIQHLLMERGIELNCECLAIGGSCVSFLLCLQIAEGMIRSGMKRNILLIGAAWNSLFLNGSDKNTSMTFGDGAAASVLGASLEKGFIDIYCRTEGQGFAVGCYPEYQTLFIDRKRVSEFAPTAFQSGIKGLMDKTGLKVEDVDVFIPHQAGSKIIEHGMALAGIPPEKTYLCLQDVGNTGAPAVQMALAKAVEDGVVRDGHLVVLAAFGTGWNYGAAAFRYYQHS